LEQAKSSEADKIDTGSIGRRPESGRHELRVLQSMRSCWWTRVQSWKWITDTSRQLLREISRNTGAPSM